ncbi:hypothetical protein HanRHA438_Chr00c14g0849971 [Helianthus annuus]|nr:hypothetical protein HanHA89_Chr17g0712881 [Helianthus annuus]KAJ0632984.1 hypothetical protein HanLR1_Chr17g0671401 [Helianthus annuus]KAJ0954514.1 hypothetical protein HanRHA438_Chr00c14g0849971 [Helianthus annuus]
MSTWTRAWKGNGSTVNTEAMHELGRTSVGAMSTWTRAWKGNGSTVNTEAMHELGRTR